MDVENDERSLFLAKVASLYYEHGYNQQKVADLVKVSRSMVSRLLAEAQEKGIVEIIVHYPWATSSLLEQELLSAFPHLDTVQVLRRGEKSYEEMVKGLGVLSAQYLNSILVDGMKIGISWGTALYQMIRALRTMHFPSVEVVQMVGATGSELIPEGGPILAQLLSQHLGADCRYLHAPLLVDTETAREALMQDRNIRETLARAQMADIALVGIGTPDPRLYSLIKSGYLSEEESRQIRAAGAVGDICAQHYSLKGEWLDISINRRVMGVSLETLSKIRRVVGVAGGSQKGAAILGALRGCYINGLITDDQAAEKILALHHSSAGIRGNSN
jgi:deoxyribonucleoside regulator